MIDNNEIVVRLESFLLNPPGGGNQQGAIPGQGVPLPSQGWRYANASGSGFIGGISAQLMVSGFSRMLSATGNQELAGGIREGAEWMFLLSRAAAMDPTAIATAAFKLSAEGIKLITQYIQKQKDSAAVYNDLDYLRMQYGVLTIKANTEISYSKYGRLQLTDRR
jgi:hypothetical protein